MAYLTQTNINGRVETHVKGRVYRFAPKPKPAQRPAAKESRRICVLSIKDHERLTLWGISQPCYGPRCTHQHWTRDAVKDMVAAGNMVWVEGSGKNVAAYTDSRVWKPTISGGTTTVLQMVVGG